MISRALGGGADGRAVCGCAGRVVGGREGRSAAREAKAEGRPAASSGSGGVERDRVPIADGMSVESSSERVWLWSDVSSAVHRMGATWDFPKGLGERSVVLRPEEGHRLEMGQPRQRDCESAEGGAHTGPNPTDRAKSGTKRHILTDAKGIPLGLVLSGANVHDKWMALPTLKDAARHALGSQKQPVHCCLDKGYDYADVEKGIRARGIVPHIRRRGEPTVVGCVRGKPRRWVVERTNSWHNRFRALLIRWERKATHYLALCQLACALIILGQTRS